MTTEDLTAEEEAQIGLTEAQASDDVSHETPEPEAAPEPAAEPTPEPETPEPEAQVNIGIEVSEKLVKYSNNGSTLSSVNFPEVGLPALVGKHRICHIHHNEPGILAKINEVFSTTGVNISAQYLQTNADVGYVVTDIDQISSKDAFKGLKKIQGTIRSRILY